jgi:hypothetical protein
MIGGVFCVPGKRKKATFVAITALAITWAACGGGGGSSYRPPPGGGTNPVTPPGSYSVNIVAASGPATHTVVVNITVQ